MRIFDASLMLALLASPALAQQAPDPPSAPTAQQLPAEVTVRFTREELLTLYDALLDKPARAVLPVMVKLQAAQKAALEQPVAQAEPPHPAPKPEAPK